LRAEIEGQWGGNPPQSEKYIDLSYYARLLQTFDQCDRRISEDVIFV
jgi:hypothetical protein